MMAKVSPHRQTENPGEVPNKKDTPMFQYSFAPSRPAGMFGRIMESGIACGMAVAIFVPI
jgi:hypothetical protein